MRGGAAANVNVKARNMESPGTFSSNLLSQLKAEKIKQAECATSNLEKTG